MTASGSGDGSSAPARVLLAVEQLRRDVPGGIGTYARGLLGGLAEAAADATAGPVVELGLLAGRAPGDHGRHRSARRADGGAGAVADGGAGAVADGGAGGAGGTGADPLGRFGWPVHASRLPGRLLTRAWVHGLGAPPEGYDVVHAVSLAAPPVRGRQGARRPALVVTVHDLAWRHHPETSTPRGRHWHDASLARALRHADALVVPSHPVADDLVAAGADPDLVTVIDEGSDHLAAPDPRGAEALLRAHGVAAPFLLTVGTIEPRKNLARLVAAYSRARATLPGPWPLVVVGPAGWGGPGAGAGGGAGSWGGVLSAEGVVGVGAVPDAVLAGLYDSARAFLYVPLSEGFGLPPLEAMHFGLPVLASTAVPSVHRAPGAEPIALLVDPLDVAAIAGSIARVATDDALREALAAAGGADTRRRTWRRAADGHVRLWESLAGRPV